MPPEHLVHRILVHRIDVTKVVRPTLQEAEAIVRRGEMRLRELARARGKLLGPPDPPRDLILPPIKAV